MAQPTKYEKETDFINQTYASSLPALDKEFTNVETSINEIRENLQMFQNDDMTGLKSGVITQESVAPAFVAYLEGVASQTAGEANTNSSNAVALANTAVIDASDAKQMASDASATAEDAKNVADGAVRDIQASVLDVRNAISDIAQFKTDTNTTLSIYEGNINSAIAAIEPSIENKFGDMSGYSDTDNSGTVTVVEAIAQEVAKQVVEKQDLTAESIAVALGYTPANNTNLTKEITDRTNAVSAEATTRANADLGLSNRIDAEEQARQTLDESLATVAKSGSYNDLSNKPTNVSSFTNDANYLTPNSTLDASKLNVSYLPTAGGTETGTITFSTANAIARNVSNSSLTITGGAVNTSGYISLIGKDSSSNAGDVVIGGRDSTNHLILRVKPTGVTIGGSEVLTRANGLPLSGGTMTGTLLVGEGSSLQKNSNNSYLSLFGSSNRLNAGASLSLYGEDSSSGRFLLRSSISATARYDLVGISNGSLQWGGKNILREDTLCTTQPTTTSTASASNPAVVVENYYDSATGNWYSVRSDGWVEQGGVSLDTASTQQSIGLNYDLGNVDYKVMITPIATSNADFRPLVANADAGSFTVYNYSKKAFFWEVKGYKAS